jgi:heme-degrading monooxygenase HmoA
LREHAPQIAHPALFRWYGDILWLNEGKLMIVRTWHGCVPLKHAEGFANHLQRTGVEHSRSIEGNRGAFVRRETQGDREHFFLATYWQDLPSVKAFAGENYQVAVTYPDDEEFELLSDPYVFQHVVDAISPL